MKRLIKILFVFMFWCCTDGSPFVCKQPFAEPMITSIDGTPSHSGTITIIGSGFGVKSSASPLKFDDFEDGTIGQELSGWKFDSSHGRNPIYDYQFIRPNSTKSAKARFDNGQYLSTFGIRDMDNGYPEVYIDTWYLYDPASPPSRNYKPFRWYTGSVSGQPDFYWQLFCHYAWSLSTDGGGDKIYPGGWTWQQANKKWVHIQGYMNTNTGGASNGTLKFWIDCKQLVNDNTWRFRPRANDPLWHSLWFGNYLGHDADSDCAASHGASYTFWDDVYIDNTQARVEIGNNPVYANCSHREIQIPLVWANDSVTITVNRGSFQSRDTVYLFAVDDNGNVNSEGYPISIVPSDEEGPAAPQGLRILN